MCLCLRKIWASKRTGVLPFLVEVDWDNFQLICVLCDIVQAIIPWYTLSMMLDHLHWPKMLRSVICLSVMWVSIHSCIRFRLLTIFPYSTDLFYLYTTGEHVFSGYICIWKIGYRRWIWLQSNGFCSWWKWNLVCKIYFLFYVLSFLFSPAFLIKELALFLTINFV